MPVIYDSHQDFATKMARIEAITLQGDLGWRFANNRGYYNRNQAEFARHIHGAMGYRKEHEEL